MTDAIDSIDKRLSSGITFPKLQDMEHEAKTETSEETTHKSFDFLNEEGFKEYGSNYIDVDDWISDMSKATAENKISKLMELKIIFSYKIRQVYIVRK